MAAMLGSVSCSQWNYFYSTRIYSGKCFGGNEYIHNDRVTSIIVIIHNDRVMSIIIISIVITILL